MSDVDYVYKAFLSYSQTADGKLAPKLQSRLHRFAKPWYRLRSMRVFRDATSISNTPELWPTIEAALQKSEYFALLASPEAAQSPWVKKEIEYWVTHRSKDKFLIILTGGELVWDPVAADFDWTRTNVLPNEIDYPLNAEPKYTDLRDLKSATRMLEGHPAFHDGIADIASTLLGRSKDELIGEDVRRHRQTKRITWSAVSALVLLTATSIFAAYTAIQNQRIAEIRQHVAQSRQLAMEARRQLEANHLDLGLLLGVQAAATYDTLEARRSILDGIRREPHLRSIAHPELGFSASGASIAFSPDGSMLATTGSRFSVVLWNSATKRVTGRLTAPGNVASVQTIEFGPAGRIIAASNGDHVFLWNAASGKLLPGGRLNARRVESIAFDPRGSRFATVGCAAYDRDKCSGASLQMWDLERLSPIGPALPGHSDIAQAVAFSTDGGLIASAARDGTVIVRDATTLAPMATFDAEVGAVRKIFFDASDRLAMVNVNGVYSRWDARTARKIHEPSSVGLLNGIRQLANFPFAESVLDQGMRGAVWAVHDDLLVTVSRGAVILVDRRKREPLSRNANPIGYTASLSGAMLSIRRNTQLLWQKQLNVAQARHLTSRVAFSRDFKFVAVAGCDATESEDARDPTDRYWRPACIASYVQVFDVESSTPVAGPYKDHDVAVLAITLGRDGQTMVSVGSDGTRTVRNLVTSEVRHFAAPDEDLALRVVAFDTDEHRLAASETSFGRDTVRILLWDRLDDPATELHRWRRNSTVSAMAFNPRNATLAMGGHGGDISLWDPRSGNPQSTLATRFADSGTYEVRALAFNHSGNLLASITTGGGLVVWDLANRQPLLRDRSVEELPLFFDRQTGEVAAGSKRVDVRLDSWRQTACDIAGRNFTWSEWSLYLPDKAYEPTCIDSLSPSDLMDQAQYLAEVGGQSGAFVAEAAALAQAQGMPVNEKVCQVGGFLGHGSAVLRACDRAIELCESESSCDLLKGNRALARALSGDLHGAASDLEFAVQRFRIRNANALASKIVVRQRWIEELRAGRNPFDAATRYELRHGEI